MAHRSIHQPAPIDDPEAVPYEGSGAGGWSARLWARGTPRWPVGPGSGPPVRSGSIVLAVAGILVVLGAGWWLLRPAPAPVESTLPFASADSGGAPGSSATGSSAPSSSASSGATSTTIAQLVVQAAGEVAEPGVYRLPPTARVDDLVREAGGLTRKADRDRVNLAAPLVDGQRIWIPAVGQGEVPEVVTGAGGGAPAGSGGPPPGAAPDAGAGAGPTVPSEPVDLNTATAEQLETLPGIGPATAAAILAYREQAGAFRTVEDLLEVRGIGDAKMEQLRPLVRV